MNRQGSKRRGEHQLSIGGAKPAVAFETERQARGNIAGKLDVLTTALGAARIGGALSGDLPQTTRQFNFWTPRSNGVQYARNAQTTLKRHNDIHTAVLVAVEAVKRSRVQKPTVSRGDRIVSLRRSLSVHKTIRDIAEREMVRMRSELKEALREVNAQEGKLLSAYGEIERLRGELKMVEQRLASAHKSLATVLPLKPHE